MLLLQKIWREMHTRPSKFIEIPVWRFLKIIPTHTLVSIYLKNQSIDPYFLVTCIWKPENWLTSYYKWSKHLLLETPIKSLGTTNHPVPFDVYIVVENCWINLLDVHVWMVGNLQLVGSLVVSSMIGNLLLVREE